MSEPEWVFVWRTRLDELRTHLATAVGPDEKIAIRDRIAEAEAMLAKWQPPTEAGPRQAPRRLGRGAPVPFGRDDELSTPIQEPQTQLTLDVGTPSEKKWPTSKRAAALLAILFISAATASMVNQALRPSMNDYEEEPDAPESIPVSSINMGGDVRGGDDATPAVEIEACKIQISSGPTIRNGWILLDTGDFFEAEVNGNSLRFKCPEKVSDIAVIVNFQDGTIRYWTDVPASPNEPSELSIGNSKPGVPDELHERLSVMNQGLGLSALPEVAPAPKKTTRQRERGVVRAGEYPDPKDFYAVMDICTNNALLDYGARRLSTHYWCEDAASLFKYGAGVKKDLRKAGEIYLALCKSSALSCDEAIAIFAEKCNSESDRLSCYRAGLATPIQPVGRPRGSMPTREEWFAKACELGHNDACSEVK